MRKAQAIREDLDAARDEIKAFAAIFEKEEREPSNDEQARIDELTDKFPQLGDGGLGVVHAAERRSCGVASGGGAAGASS